VVAALPPISTALFLAVIRSRFFRLTTIMFPQHEKILGICGHLVALLNYITFFVCGAFNGVRAYCLLKPAEVGLDTCTTGKKAAMTAAMSFFVMILAVGVILGALLYIFMVRNAKKVSNRKVIDKKINVVWEAEKSTGKKPFDILFWSNNFTPSTKIVLFASMYFVFGLVSTVLTGVRMIPLSNPMFLSPLSKTVLPSIALIFYVLQVLGAAKFTNIARRLVHLAHSVPKEPETQDKKSLIK
jgi:hypothetical protein